GGDTNVKVATDSPDASGNSAVVTNPYPVPMDTSEITSIGTDVPPTGPDVPRDFQQNYDGSIDGTSVQLALWIQISPSPFALQDLNCGIAPVFSVRGHDGCSFAVVAGQDVSQTVTWLEEPNVMMGLHARGLSPAQIVALTPRVTRSSDGSSASLEPVP